MRDDSCDIINIGVCDKCGKGVRGERFAKNDYMSFFDLGRAGWGSCMDGSDIKFKICSECLHEFIETFNVEARERIHNSGSNYSMDTVDWIRKANGLFTDEEYEEYGFYSPRQIKAYEERFPKCVYPKLRVYDDGSGATYCKYGASGNRDFTAGLNTCTECYDCTAFKDKALSGNERDYDSEAFFENLNMTDEEIQDIVDNVAKILEKRKEFDRYDNK